MRDDRVAQFFKAVHPIGNPMSHSTQSGFNCPPSAAITAWSSLSFDRSAPFFRVSDAGDDPLCIDDVGVGHFFAAAGNPFLGFSRSKLPLFCASFARGVGQIGFRKSRGERPAERSAIAFVLLASGVGNNPDPVSPVRGTNGARRYAMPFRIIPDRGQVSEYRVQPSTKQSCHVLQHGPDGSNHANGSNDFPVESRTGAGKSGAETGVADILTRESSRDNISLTLLEIVCRHIIMAGDAWKILGQDGLRVRLHFAKGDGFEPACPFEAKAESADT